MDLEPPQWWQKFRLMCLLRWPLDQRKKIKKLLVLGDNYLKRGENALAQRCYSLSKELAEEAGTVHLLKRIEQRIQ